MPTYFLQSDPANPPPGLNASHLVETEMVGESSLTPYICAQGRCRPVARPGGSDGEKAGLCIMM